jgi:hypothetical protein
LAGDGEEAFVVACGGDRFIAKLDRCEDARFDARIPDGHSPRPVAIPPAGSDVSARRDQHVGHAA